MDASPPPHASRAAERELLVRCARLHLTDAEAARVRDLAASGEVDWNALAALAERHKLVAFLHRHLKSVPIPAEAAALLRAGFRRGAHRSLALAGELRRLLDALDAAGVAALVYKGPALAMQAYGDLSLRTYSDLDLLVRPEDAPRAISLLAAEGYDAVRPFSPAQDRLFRRVDGDYQLLHRETGALVELHCRVSSLRFCIPLETAELMRRARPVPLGGTEVPAPAPDDALLISCIHGCKHRWRRLEWVASTAELLRGGSVDVDTVLARAEELGARRTVLLGLSLARGMLDAPLPPAIVREIAADRGIARLAAEAERAMFAEDADAGEDADRRDGGEETAANLAYTLRARDGAAGRARSLWRWMTIPTPEDWAWRPLPDPLFPLYRVLRPVRLLLRHGPRAAGRR